MKQGVMALHSGTWQEIQLPSNLAAPARPTFWMGWLVSASFATPFSLDFSQTFPVLLHKHVNVCIIWVSLTTSVPCEICRCIVVHADGEQSTLKDTLCKVTKTFTMAGNSLKGFTHWSQRAMSEDILFRWKFQTDILYLLQFPNRN